MTVQVDDTSLAWVLFSDADLCSSFVVSWFCFLFLLYCRGLAGFFNGGLERMRGSGDSRIVCLRSSSNQRLMVDFSRRLGLVWPDSPLVFLLSRLQLGGNEVLCKLFKEKGRVIDIYIPQKQSRDGRRFGFFRFLEVHNPAILEKQLNQIWIGAHKIVANLARFSKHDHPRDGINFQRKDAGGHGGFKLLSGKRQQEVTFTEVVSQPAQRKQDKENQATRLDQQLFNLVIESRKSDFEWLKGSFTEVLKSSCLLSNIQDRML
ncbi:hypothetical protein Ancab_034909 [Ancistrocladus abbreviatus]